MLAISVVARSGRGSAVAAPVSCTPAGVTYGTLTFDQADTPPNPINIIANTGTPAQPYNLWVRLQVPAAASSALLLNLDNATGSNCYSVSASSLAPNTWTWVNAAQPTLTPGNHKLVVTGLESGAKLDRIEFLSSGCMPTGTGDDCITAATSSTPPTVSVTTPATGATVSDTVAVTATAAGTGGANVSSVQFQVDGQNAGSPDTTAPYSYSWNTSGLSNGTHTLTAIATDNNSPALSTTSGSVSVTVNNTPVSTCSANSSTPVTAPTVSQNQAATGYTQIGLQWSGAQPSPDCTIKGYNVYRNNSNTPLNSTLLTGTSYTDTGLLAGTNYTYRVQAVDSQNNTANTLATFSTTQDNQAPTVPGSVAATAISPGRISLSWSASTDLPNPGGSGVAGYNIYRSTSSNVTPGGTPLNGVTPVSGTSYADNSLTAGATYYYVVTAVDNAVPANESAPGSVVHATAPIPTCTNSPSQPGAPAAGATTLTSVSFSWKASTPGGANCSISGYNIYQVNGSTYTLISTINNGSAGTISVTIKGLTPNTSYTYAIEAFGSGQNSDKTKATPITIATQADTTAPTAPATLTATPSGTGIALNWPPGSDNVGVTSYNIYRSGTSGPIANVPVAAGTITYAYTDTTGAPSTTYTYQVSALDAANNESSKTSSAAVTTPAAGTTVPTAPGTVTAPVVGNNSVTLKWSAPKSGKVTGYHVYINGVLDTYSKDSFTASGGTISCLAPGVSKYTVTIKAYNSAGNSPAVTTTFATPSGGGLPGDFNCDGHVNGFDLNALASNWLNSGVLPIAGDANGDTVVNGFDLNALASNWNK